MRLIYTNGFKWCRLTILFLSGHTYNIGECLQNQFHAILRIVLRIASYVLTVYTHNNGNNDESRIHIIVMLVGNFNLEISEFTLK